MKILITGANRGIGLELARQFRQRGDDVVAVCRTASDALESLDVRIESGIDVTDGPSLESLACVSKANAWTG
jgi:NAD(P)-dependent dehydrogenase (short-subunit alcohol dehydrogenase family)